MSEHEEAMKTAIEVYGEKAGMYAQLTLKDADKFVSDIEQALSQNAAEDVGLAAHSLKSIMKQVQAHDVADLAYEIEQAGEAKDLETAQSHLQPLQAAYAKTRIFLSSFV